MVRWFWLSETGWPWRLVRTSPPSFLPGAPLAPFGRSLMRLAFRRGCTAGGAQPPEGHLGFVDDEALSVAGVEAWRVTHHAVDVGDGAAVAAHEVVVVV